MINKLAIIDYGIGGFDLFKMIKTDFPKFPILYFSDSGFIPYGKLKKEELKERIFSIFDFLKSKDITHVVVACHAASTVTDGYNDLKIINMIDSTINILYKYNFNSIGIIGGGRTIRSRIYKKSLINQDKKVFQRNAQQLSIIIESGSIDNSILEESLNKILKPIKNVEVLLLACTHYPAIKKEISTHMNSNCVLIDPMDNVYSILQKKLLNTNNTGKDQIYTTGDISLMRIACLNAFAININNVKNALIISSEMAL